MGVVHKLLYRVTNAKLYLCIGIVLCTMTMGFTTYFLRHGLDSNYNRVIKSGFQGKRSFDIENELFAEAELMSKSSLSTATVVGKVFAPPTVRTKNYMDKIIYNRVGKCGSRSMLSLITRLSSRNNFLFYASPVSNRTRVPLPESIKEVQVINNLPSPSLYSRHIHYLDLFKYGISGVVYINMIRDPIERFSSQYHFLRYGDGIKAQGRRYEPWEGGDKDMDINDCILKNHQLCTAGRLFYVVPYFCGQDFLCHRPSKESLYRAKVHVMENYLVVGYLEDFTGMLQVLEKLLPQFFTGSLKLWKDISADTMINTSTLKKQKINETAYAVLRERMEIEYDFYNFVKTRFRIIKKQMEIFDDDEAL
uniref:uronyl 2-sulfotransferase-like n=1 Tax=Styela clava TaxID=7725 RepID=UPI001939A7CF|nr:uronyl 2-sulfotransferase-like [Styela clava]